MEREVDFPVVDPKNGDKLSDHFINRESNLSELQGELCDPRIVWAKGSDILKGSLDNQIFTAWIKPLTLEAVRFPAEPAADANAAATLVAPNKFCCDHVKRHYGELISSALSKVIGAKETSLNFRVSALSGKTDMLLSHAGRGSAASPSPLARVITSIMSDKQPPAQRKEPLRSASREPDETNLNPTYNFSNFVVGTCNQFAHAACLKVAENPGISYNPLFIYGGVGLGKTHLANAIGNTCRRKNMKVLLTSSETFVSELISSLKTNNMDRFKCKFRSLDVLIIDDIQFIIGKERTQEEFFHTFNELYNRRRQIVITSDKLPQELIGLEERLRTRFASGLSADLQPPDFETRVAILTKKSEANSLLLPGNVVQLLAERIDTNVRELEGALNRLQALCSVYESQPSLELAEEVLRRIAPVKKNEATVELIQKAVASRYSVSVSDILGKRRTHNIAFARQVAMHLSRKLTGRSFPEIGALFGGRDHSTVIHAQRVITERLSSSPEFQGELRDLERQILS